MTRLLCGFLLLAGCSRVTLEYPLEPQDLEGSWRVSCFYDEVDLTGDYDDIVFAPPGSTPLQPGRGDPPRTPLDPRQPTAEGTDLAVTDIYATRLRQGEVWIRITNRGPRSVQQQPLRLVTDIDGVSAERMMNVTLAAGQTQAYNTGRMIDTRT